MITLELRPWPNEKNTKVDFVVAKIFMFDKLIKTFQYIFTYEKRISIVEDNQRVNNCIELYNYLCKEVSSQPETIDNLLSYSLKIVKKSYTGHSEPETVFIFEFK